MSSSVRILNRGYARTRCFSAIVNGDLDDTSALRPGLLDSDTRNILIVIFVARNYRFFYLNKIWLVDYRSMLVLAKCM